MNQTHTVSYARRWHELFAQREVPRYSAEDKHILQAQPQGELNKNRLIHSLLSSKRSPADAPEAFCFPALRQFLSHINAESLRRPLRRGLRNEVILIDERRDDFETGDDPKQWDNPRNPGHFKHPPKGAVVFSKAASLEETLDVLSQSVSWFYVIVTIVVSSL